MAHYLQVLADKTGSLISAAAHYGTLFSGADEAAVTASIAYGEKVGVAFQLADDVIDLVSDASTLGQDYYRYVEERQAMIGERTGETFTLGDRVTVRLLEAAPVAGALRFELLSEGVRGNPPSGRRTHKGRSNSFGPKSRRKR